MKRFVPANLCVAGLLACGVAVFAQDAGQTPAKSGAQTSSDQQITVTGCVQREADYRSARDAGRGGVAGTGVGAGNEFVLTNASTSSAKGGATGTAGSPASGSAAYELTGPNEGQVSQYVGRRVEITGKLKAAERDAAGRPTGGATAGQPPAGVDVTSKDLKLRELEVVSVREATGTCTPMK
ncbi:MAG TPA: hypothetical protein VFJ02_12940 [Vicinamibacterales bacterium]|nr:hypothetical protein [Vicinamibacterales bacterium]